MPGSSSMTRTRGPLPFAGSIGGFHASSASSARRRSYSQRLLRSTRAPSQYAARMTRRPTILLPLIAILVVAVAVPVLAAKPSSPPGQAKEKVPSAPIFLSGTIQLGTNADGEASYTLRDGGTTYTLEAGPKWFFEANPLDPYVGEDVTIEGEIAEGTTEVDVISVNGV